MEQCLHLHLVGELLLGRHVERLGVAQRVGVDIVCQDIILLVFIGRIESIAGGALLQPVKLLLLGRGVHFLYVVPELAHHLQIRLLEPLWLPQRGIYLGGGLLKALLIRSLIPLGGLLDFNLIHG